MIAVNYLDAIIVALSIASLIAGYRRGFVRQAVKLAGFFVAFFVAYRCSRAVAPLLANLLPFPALSQNFYLSFFLETLDMAQAIHNAIAFALLFFAVKVGLNIAAHFLHHLLDVPGIAPINRGLGALLAFLEVALVSVIAVNILAVLPADGLQHTLGQSFFAQLILKTTPFLGEALREIWQQNPPVHDVL
ncbi:hypothetical protein BSNK01_22290 [Bacillaceae bacterium]